MRTAQEMRDFAVTKKYTNKNAWVTHIYIEKNNEAIYICKEQINCTKASWCHYKASGLAYRDGKLDT